MPDPTDWDPPFPTKFTLACGLIYFAPLLCFFWFGPWWKAASIITVGIGVWKSAGFLRRAFGIAFLLSILIWGTHAITTEENWPGPLLLMIWWFWSWATRWHADGAQEEVQRRARGWE